MCLTYRLLAVDVDGTLLDSRHQLPAANRAALHRAHEAGMTICICTGRSLPETRQVIDDIGLDLDAGIFVFGAIITDLRRMTTVERTTIPAGLTDQLVAYFQDRGYPVLLLYDESVAGFDCLLVAGEWNLPAYERWLKLSPARIERVQTWRPLPYEPVRVGVIDDPERIQATIARLKREGPGDQVKCHAIYAPNYGLHVIECFEPSVNKWQGLLRLAARLGLTPHQVVAVGDDVNDLEMIAGAGLGVAMGNAIDQVKAVAALQVACNDDCGVAELLQAVLPAGKPVAPRPSR